MNTPFIINIGRQLGSGGREIGRLLADRFGIAYYDKEILSLAAQESGLGPDVFERKDERKGFFGSVLSVVQPFIGGGGDFYNNQLSEENLFTLQSRVIQKVAAERSCVFIGRVADYILRNHPRHINIFIAANLDERIKCIMEREKLERKAARNRIEESDEERADYYNFYSSGTWGSADTYDLCINSSVLGYERTADYIAQFISEKLGVELPAPAPQTTATAEEVRQPTAEAAENL